MVVRVLQAKRQFGLFNDLFQQLDEEQRNSDPEARWVRFGCRWVGVTLRELAKGIKRQNTLQSLMFSYIVIWTPMKACSFWKRHRNWLLFKELLRFQKSIWRHPKPHPLNHSNHSPCISSQKSPKIYFYMVLYKYIPKIIRCDISEQNE